MEERVLGEQVPGFYPVGHVPAAPPLLPPRVMPTFLVVPVAAPSPRLLRCLGSRHVSQVLLQVGLLQEQG